MQDVRKLGSKPLGAFDRVHSIKALLAAERDSILVLDEDGGLPESGPDIGPDIGPAEIGQRPYILSLRGARLIGGTALRPLPDLESGQKIRPPEGMKGAGKQILVTADGALIDDSFTRGRQIHPNVQPDGASGWRARFGDEVERRAGTSVFAEIITGHFGHALVDTTARLWPYADADLVEGLRGLPLIGLGLGKVRGNSADWSPFVRMLMTGCGVDVARAGLVGQPAPGPESAQPAKDLGKDLVHHLRRALVEPGDGLWFERLLVPRRLSPLFGRAAPAWLRMMRQAGDHIIAETGEGRRAATGRIFLSRSRLPEGSSRFMGRETEDRLDALFAAHGFEIIHPQELPLGTQIELIRSADAVAGCIGSALHLIAFDGPRPAERPGLHLFRLRPSYFDLGVDGEITTAIGGRLSDFIVRSPRDKSVPLVDGHWNLKPGDFRRLEAELETEFPR